MLETFSVKFVLDEAIIFPLLVVMILYSPVSKQNEDGNKDNKADDWISAFMIAEVSKL